VVALDQPPARLLEPLPAAWWLEPVAALALATHGALVLLVTDDRLRPAAAAPVAALAVLALAGLSGRRSTGWLVARATTIIVAGAALQLLPEAGGYFLLWFFVAVATYPLYLPPVGGWSVAATIPLLYLLVRTGREQSDPLGIDVLRSCSLAILGAIVVATSAAQRASMAAYRAAARDRDESLALLTTLIHQAPVGLAFWDRDLRYRMLNERLADINGMPADGHYGRTVGEMEPDLAWLHSLLQQVRDTRRPHLDVEVSGSPPSSPGDARRHWLSSFFPVVLAGEVLGVGGVVLEVTRERQVLDELAHAATHDSLTGLPNRALFSDRLEMALAGAARSGERVALLFLDLDRFKTVNDALGHLAGDQLLREVAGRLAAAVRPGDTVARLGGDEFAVLCPNLSTPTAASAVAARVVAALRPPVSLAQRRVHPSASVGLAVAPAGSRDAEALLMAADIAMYRAKDGGRDKVAVFDDHLQAEVMRRLDLEAGLRGAVSDGGLPLVYQPILSVQDATTVNLEALSRWPPPDRLAPGIAASVSPQEFIAVAEDTGLIVPLGRLALARACRDAARWRAEHGVPTQVAVNLSARELAQPDLTDAVRAALADSGLPAGALQLEITESTLMSDVQHDARVLREIRALGVSLAVDDFGTGYSSLSYLRDFPVDVLKIDRTFVSRLPGDAGLVRAMISIAHTVGAVVVAEGVETPEQLEVLRGLGCDHVQGYLLSRPLVPEDVASYLVDLGAATPR
jgi:diguanylate cyclase (GGDEF)-like protein